MLTYILVLVLNGTPAPVVFPPEHDIRPAPGMTLEQCQKAGEAWVKETAKLRGMSKGDFVCVPVEASK